jgi:hypothetical protein
MSYRWITSFSVCTLALFSVIAVGCGGGRGSSLMQGIQEITAFRSIAIPDGDISYRTFNPQVIESQAEMDRFLERPIGVFQPGPDGEFYPLSWRENPAFMQAIQEANIDFDREALVLLQHTVSSGGIDVTLDTPQLQGEALISTIRVSRFTGGTAAFETYGFALAVSKAAVKEVRVAVVDGEGNALPSSINLRVGQ